MLREDAVALRTHLAGLNALAIAGEAERVHVERVAEEGESARTNAEVFVMVDHVFIDAFVVTRAAEGPRGELAVVLAERAENRVVLLGEFLTLSGDHALHALTGFARHHQRVRGDLLRIELTDEFHVARDHVERLAAETEHHIDVAGREEILAGRDAVIDLSAGAELRTVGELQNAVIKALHADRHAVHQSLQVLEQRGGDFLRIGFAGDFADMREELPGEFERLDQFILQNCGGAAAHVDRLEVVTEILRHLHLSAQILEVFARLVFLEEEAMEGAVGAQRMAERHMHVEQVLMSFLRGRRRLEDHRIHCETAVNVVLHDLVGHADLPVRHQVMGLLCGRIKRCIDCHGFL